MQTISEHSAHTFHIPVMGTGFTVDTALRVAKYGISSVISLVDDKLIEQMRKYHCERSGEAYEPIHDSDSDPRARRITEYLNLLDRLVQRQVKDLQASPFEEGSEITRYYELLPESALKDTYYAMLKTDDSGKKAALQSTLRGKAVPGTIDVNIMTKLDRIPYVKGEPLPCEYSDAKSALRGFANSTLRSSIVCSAGMNRDFYKYFESFDDFYPDSEGGLRKKIVLKVSDFRSAEIQGKFLAKRGLWVSEYRIESGLNCGGHAFATKGMLLGPIMDEFRKNREQLAEKLLSVYNSALGNLGYTPFDTPLDMRVTVQGGIGTASENNLLLEYYNVDSTGWGTPFMLVPEVVNIDKAHFDKLAEAADEDVYLSDCSPLGVPFWNLRTSASEQAKRDRISIGKPGSPCRKGHLKLATGQNGLPICKASAEYQRHALTQLDTEGLSPEKYQSKKDAVLAKSCICHDLGGGATLNYGIDPDATPAICCGPNIVNFSKIASLKEMVDHIYGRFSLMTNPERPNMFVRELMLYIDYFKEEAEQSSADLTARTQKYLAEFKSNLLEGIENYLETAEHYFDERKERFIRELDILRAELENINLASVIV